MKDQLIANSDFDELLLPFQAFGAVTSDSIYKKFPNDWWILLTDVRGSTAAIQQGRYRDVNLMGSACITSVLNVCGRTHIPFVFGGDGATMIVPANQLESAKQALQATRELSRKQFNLDMRVGCVPIAEVHSNGRDVLVAKHEVAPGNFLAVFRGGGLALAEQWVKSGGPNGKDFNLPDTPSGQEAPLEGLTCRWKPLKSRHGQMLSILISARGTGAESTSSYTEAIEYFSHLLESNELIHSRPVPAGGLNSRNVFDSIAKELKLSGSSGIKKVFVFMQKIVEVLFERMFFTFNIKAGRFDAKEYKNEMSANTDFRKFDDVLRMVIDCTPEQQKSIVAYLEKQYQAGRLYYGLHASPEALMTCLVFSPFNNQHIHFVDGSHGGYAMAATQLKSQMKKS